MLQRQLGRQKRRPDAIDRRRELERGVHAQRLHQSVVQLGRTVQQGLEEQVAVAAGFVCRHLQEANIDGR